MKPRPFRRLTSTQGYIVCLGATLALGLPLWLIFKLSPDLFIFVLVWFYIRPIYKIYRELDL